MSSENPAMGLNPPTRVGKTIAPRLAFRLLGVHISDGFLVANLVVVLPVDVGLTTTAAVSESICVSDRFLLRLGCRGRS